MNINVKAKQKNPPPMGEAIKKTRGRKKLGALPTTPQLEGQQAQATSILCSKRWSNL
jgi:hypothetical protein